MRLLKFPARYHAPANLETRRLLLSPPQLSDYHSWAELRNESEDFLKPFEPKWSSRELTKDSYRHRFKRQEAEIKAGTTLPWFVRKIDEPQQVMGGLTLSNIRRGVAQTGTLGYWMGQRFAGKGFMKEAVLAIAQHAFEDQGLHRIEAATLLENAPSQHLLLNCGFQKEGIARYYLKINDQWQDHILFALVKSDA